MSAQSYRVVVLVALLGIVAPINFLVAGQGALLLTATHVLPSAIFLGAFRSQRASVVGSVGLLLATIWIGVDAITADSPEQRRLYPVTNGVVWLVALAITGFIAARLRMGSDR